MRFSVNATWLIPLSSFVLLTAAPLFSEANQKKILQTKESGYTVNFPNVSVVELIKFISQIGNINFIYHQDELNFNISLLSDSPTSLENILSAFHTNFVH